MRDTLFMSLASLSLCLSTPSAVSAESDQRSAAAEASSDAEPTFVLSFEAANTNWTYTYLKAKPGQEAALREFILKNWFVMDEAAVDQGLFRDFQIIDNLSESSAGTAREWDFIVAVEYFGDEGYPDIRDGFEAIRTEHETQLVNGLGLRELGSIVRSERVVRQNTRGAARTCVGDRFAVIAPYLGRWDEYFEGTDTGKSGGILEVSVDPFRCNLEKHFILHGRDFSYSTFGYYDPDKGAWIERYQFSNGRNSLYEWRQEEDGLFLYLSDPNNSDVSQTLRRNQWTDVVDGKFEIIAQASEDGGATWSTLSTTLIVRR